MSELEQIEQFWLNHGIYKSCIEAYKHARENGFNKSSLKEIFRLYTDLVQFEILK